MDINEKLFEKNLCDGMIITGGHFMILGDGKPNLNEGTINSFEAAIKAYKKAKDKSLKVGFGILINNMGSVCDAKKKVCAVNPEELKEHFELPEEYNIILKKYGVERNEVKVYWEKSLRNRGKKELLKQIEVKKKYVEYKEGAYWFVNPKDGRRITLSRPNPNDKYGIPACPLIMAAFAYQKQQDGYSSSLNFYYIDLENEENIPNYFAIEKGRVVAEEFYENLNIINIYLLKDRIVTSYEMGKK